MPKRRRLLLITTTLVVAVAIGSAAYVLHARHTPHYAVRELHISDQTVRLQVADTDAKRELGLGRRASMSRNEGMVFTFDQPQKLCFWMKDMRFPLDMIWLDARQQVIQIKPDIAANTYPTTYCSPAERPARYVVELMAGRARQLGIQQGELLRF